jgi:uncharacterized membrane protein
MAYCQKCGNTFDGPFCPACGTGRVAAAVQSSAQLPENVASCLCYMAMGIPGLVFLAVEPYSANHSIRFHAFQALFFTIATVCAGIVLGAVSTVLVQIPGGWVLALLLLTALAVGAIVCWLMLMYKAYHRERFLLPVIGPFAQKQS